MSKKKRGSMYYKTRTYIAADWLGDYDVVERLHKWNNSKYWSFSFTDAHDLMQARDNSLNCSIKSSLSKGLDVAKTFILIVGNNTRTVRNGSCQYCKSYNSYACTCSRGYNVDYRSYIEYECEKAVKDRLKIVVLYNGARVNKSKCPDIIKNIGTHVAMQYYESGLYYWNYQAIKNAIE